MGKESGRENRSHALDKWKTRVSLKASSTNRLCFCRELFCSFCCVPFLRMFLIFFLFQNISFLAHRSLEHLCRPLGGYLSLLSTLCQQVPWNLALGEGLETAGLTGACECQGLSSATPPLPQLVSRDASLAVGHLGMWKHCHTIWLFSRPPFGNIMLGG